MFKIESYVTPLILKYVDKYVKNIRPQDAQVSLWGGDVCFQNLDLKLEVLEEELQLPFNFLSGHIHELTIHVPWTALQSEPIKITINTIEFVLKLRDPSEVRSPSLKDTSKKNPRNEEMPGIMASLINKIANNIQLTCHNIILKYIEEDIVVSMNIQHFFLSSANESWQPAFIDVSPTKVLLRKLIDVNDLTICLDKRNTAGKIEVCQEPILYRCSLQFRILRRYNVTTKESSCITRIDMHTKRMEMSISSLQLPMLLRLFNLGMALKLGKIKSETDLSGQSDALLPDGGDTNQESYASWIWNNMVPSIFPSEDDENEKYTDSSGLILHFGCYIDSFKIDFKIVEFIGEQIVSKSKKIRYQPVFKFHLDKVYFDAVMCGLTWFNYKGGVSEIVGEFLGDCPCGSKRTMPELFKSSNPLQTALTDYLKDTLMDEESIENAGKQRSYNTKWSNHFIYVNEECLKTKTPAISFDIVHFVDIPSDQNVSEVGSDLEYSNFSEKYLLRFFVGGFDCKIGSDFIHRMDALQSYANGVDYPPYYTEKVRPSFAQLPPCSTEDYEALMSEIPLKEIQITVSDARVTLHFWDHEKSSAKLRKKISTVDVATVSPTSRSVQLSLEHLEFGIVNPLYPHRLIYTTCQLPEPPSKLFDPCFVKTMCNIRKFAVSIQSPATDASDLVLCPANINFKARQLLLPELWESQLNLIKSEHLLEITNISLSLASLDCSTLFYLAKSLNERKVVHLTVVEPSKTAVHIDVELEKLVLRNVKTFSTNCVNVAANCVIGTIGQKCSDKKNLVFMWPHSKNGKRLSLELPPFLSLTAQLPLAVEQSKNASFVELKMAEGIFNLDLLLVELINQPAFEVLEDQKFQKFKQQDSITESIVETPKRIHSSEKGTKKNMPTIPSIHSSSEKDLPIEPERVTEESETETTVEDSKNAKMSLANYYLMGKKLILNIEIKQITCLYFENSLMSASVTELMVNMSDKSKNCLIIDLPIITVNSSLTRALVATNSNTNYLAGVQVSNPHKTDSFPWKLSLNKFSVQSVCNNTENVILAPISTNITVAVSVKAKHERPVDEQPDDEAAEISLNFHIDNTPIQINLIVEQIRFLVSAFNKLAALMTTQPSKSSSSAFEKLEFPSSADKSTQHQLQIDQQTEVREFLAMTTIKDEEKSSAASSSNTSKTAVRKSNELSLWLQWTISKFSIHLHTLDKKEKVMMDLEDIIFSLDKQDIYFKLKTKVATMSGQYYLKTSEHEAWQKNESFRITTTSSSVDNALDTENDIFLDLTLTKAETANVHSKWGTFKHHQTLNPTLTEIIVKVQQVDATIDVDLLTKLMQPMVNVKSVADGEEVKGTVDGNVGCVANMPLVHLESKGLRLFLPIKCTSTDCSVYIMKINKVSVVPTVENPINRAQLRPDIYTKAAQLRLINLAGSKVEDRQYELGLKSISLSTANWTEVVKYFKNDETSTNHKNPAFEWNNLQNDETLNNFNILTILKDFNFSIIYAPPVVFQSVVVVGEAVELNCFTDLNFEIDTRQIELAKSVVDKLGHIVQLTSPKKEFKLKKLKNGLVYVEVNGSIFRQSPDSSKTLDKEEDDNATVKNKSFKKSFSFVDSGVDSSLDGGTTSYSTRKVKSKIWQRNLSPASSINSCDIHIPYEISIISGISTFTVYQYEETCENNRLPLLSVEFIQPNMLISYNLNEKSAQFSLFDAKVALGSPMASKEFEEVLFETKAGEPNVLGIVQPWLQVKQKKSSHTANEQLSLEIRRPMKFSLSDRKLDKVLNLKLVLEEILHIKPKSTSVESTISSGGRYKIVRDLFGKLNAVNVSCGQAVVEVLADNKYSMKGSFDGFEGSVKISERPEKINFDLKLRSLLVSDQKAIIVHPLSVYVAASLTNEYWKKEPLIFVYVNSNVVEIDLNPTFLRNLEAVKRLFGVVLEQYLTLAEKRSALLRVLSEEVIAEHLIHIPMPKVSSSKANLVQNEEHYQDDLRAGAFQFIETFCEKEHPLPYQIQIINKEMGIVCWRYPQPRSLSRVEVFPVPMNSSKVLSINCQIEYYSEIHKEFKKYCGFSISDNETKCVELPERKTASSIWRTVMMDFVLSDDDDEDDDEMPEQQTSVRLHPKILIACIRIDSFFSTQIIPNLEWKMQLDKIQLNLNNSHCEKSKTPEILKFYEANDEIPKLYRFLTATLSELKVCGSLYDNLEVVLHKEFSLSLDILDYSYLTNQPLIEKFSMKSMMELKQDQLIVNAMAEEIRVNYGPSVGHTLAVSEKLWKGCAGPDEVVLASKYIICNNTSIYFHSRQCTSDGNELADGFNLKPKSFSMYTFPKCNQEQMLQFSCQESKWEFSAPLLISDSNVASKCLAFANGVFLVVSFEAISTTQQLIKLSGQIEFYNMTSNGFSIQYKMQASTDEVQAREFQLSKKGNTSLFCLSNSTIQQSMRLKLSNEVGKGWSGEIPLKEIISNSRPWLVKVPSSINKGYSSFWVRIIREDIPCQSQPNLKAVVPQRVLVIVWPLFMLQSCLSCDTTAQEETTGQLFTVMGKGEKRELEFSGTHEDDHTLSLESSQFDADKNQVLISYNMIDKKQFFCIPEKLTKIDQAIESLMKKEEIRWPCSREEELRWDRPNTHQLPTTPYYSFSKDHELSCALKLTVSSNLFVNSIGHAVRLTKAAKNVANKSATADLVSCIIEPNNILMPFHMDDYFSLEVLVGDVWIGEQAICLNNEKPPSSLTSQTLPFDGCIPVCIPTDFGVIKLLLTSINENNIRILILSSAFIVANHVTKFNLKCWAFCLPKNEKRLLSDFRLQTANDDCIYQLDSNPKGEKNVKGVAVAVFQNISHDKRPKKPKTKTDFNYFVAFFDEHKQELSQPLLINNNRTKNSLNVALFDRFIPISTSNIFHQEQHFVSLYLDKIPIMSIENSTDFSIYVAQCENSPASGNNEASTSNSLTKPVHLIHEILEEILVWHQVIPARGVIYYTPPTLDEIFPEMQSTIDFGLAFACFSGFSDNNIRWSQPIKIDKTKEIFFNVPLYGALRLTIDMESETIRLVLDYVSQNLVFSAQDIRSRLLRPATAGLFSFDAAELTPTSSLTAVTSMNNNLEFGGDSFREVDNGVWQFKNLKMNVYSDGFKVVLFKDGERRSCRKDEIVAINLDEIKLQVVGVQRHVQLSIMNIQVDNQLYRSGGAYDFPVILCSGQEQQMDKLHQKLAHSTQLHDLEKVLINDQSEPIFAVNVNFYKNDSTNSVAVACGEPNNDYNVESIHLKISPIRAYFEDTYINLLLDYLMESLPNQNLIYQSQRPNIRESCVSGSVLVPDTVVQQAKYFSMPIRIKLFRIEPLNILLSVHTCMRLYIALDHSPLYFSAYERTNINTLPLKLGNTLGMQYLSRAIFGAGWVIGSLEILGSPSGLARSFSSGLRDFVSMPLQGLFRGPWGFVMGITQGSTSLVRHIAAGTVNSVTKLATSVARNLDRLSLDSEHVERTDALRRNLPLGLSDGLSQGLTGFGISMLSAVGGLVHHSLQATSPVGVMTGMGKGIVGALTKPISGAAELLALTGQGVLQSVGYNTLPISRLSILPRQPRIEPSNPKLVWNYLPEMFRSESVLFSTIAEMESINGESRKPVMLGLLSKVFVIIDLTAESTMEMLTLDRVQPSLAMSKPNVIVMKVRDSKSSSTSPNRLADQQSTDRVFQYVQQSAFYASLNTNGFSQIYENRSLSSLSENQNSEFIASEQRHVFHIADGSAQHLLEFLHLAKSSTSIKSNKYLVYDL